MRPDHVIIGSGINAPVSTGDAVVKIDGRNGGRNGRRDWGIARAALADRTERAQSRHIRGLARPVLAYQACSPASPAPTNINPVGGGPGSNAAKRPGA